MKIDIPLVTQRHATRHKQITWNDFKQLEKKETKKMIRDYNTQKWMEEILHEPCLKWYRIGKKIGYDLSYRNSKQSFYLAMARTNSLQLKVHLGRCKLCRIENEEMKTWSTLLLNVQYTKEKETQD